ncbi:hypothetical protein DL766_008904 [Monosporascus sp. MC13-8B]|uniref:Uncharacterized protein n=1 Tax=Monosporascus cannonballus TaxID=155416 RepID=A0ABY0GXU8_9PEZI|nr:hypothetical protein DL762_009294 [Monosporascus cannonballus]RYP17398.1 hypothetical protein DL766_008904 [Monosporascus sp. MC13-8B]
MPYPGALERFIINELGKYTDFKKQIFKLEAFGEVTSIARSNIVASAGQTFTPSPEDGAGHPLRSGSVGHKVVSKAVKVGSKAKDVKVGDRTQEPAAYTVQDTYGAPYPKVSIVGLGGLGHFPVLIMGKRAQRRGDAARRAGRSPLALHFDYLLNTADMTNKFNLADYLFMLKVGKHSHQVGPPDKANPEPHAPDAYDQRLFHRRQPIGNRHECPSMSKFATEKKLFP